MSGVLTTPVKNLFYFNNHIVIFNVSKEMAYTPNSESTNLTSIQSTYEDRSTLLNASANNSHPRKGSLTNTLLIKTNSEVLSESLELMEFRYQEINNNK
jgi:hypothetical protein